MTHHMLMSVLFTYKTYGNSYYYMKFYKMVIIVCNVDTELDCVRK